MRYELFYWPSIPGRGEFVRLVLEQAGAAYVDIARIPGAGMGVAALRVSECADRHGAHPARNDAPGVCTGLASACCALR